MECEPWITAADATDCSSCAGVDIEDGDQWIRGATELLSHWTHGLYGICTETVIPQWDCSHRQWFWQGRDQVQGIRLGFFPLVGVTSVMIDGDEKLAPGAFTIREKEWLLFSEPSVAWPTDGTVQVTIKVGTAPDEVAKRAAATLACQLAKACQGDGSNCALPPNTRQLTRQGLQVVLKDPAQLLTQNGMLGIYEVDLLLSRNANDYAEVVIPGRPAPVSIETWRAP